MTVGSAHQEVDQTLQVSRLRIDLGVSAARLVICSCFAAISLFLTLRSAAPYWTPFVSLVGLTCYAVVARVLTVRIARPWIGHALNVVDLFAISGFYAAMRTTALARADPEDFARWVLYTHSAILSVFLYLNGLRGDRRSSIVAALTALGLFVFEQWRLGLSPPPPAIWSGAAVIVVVAAMGVVSADRSRARLETHARLRLLRRYLPSAVVSQAINPLSEGDRPPRRVTATVLVSDIRGYTTLSESLAPTEVMAQLNEYHSAMLAEVAKEGGMVDRFLGDGLVVVFGLDDDPLERSDAGAERAVRCGRAMIAALERVNHSRRARGLEDLRIGIGIHTGVVLAGTVGVADRRLEFSVMGEAVEVATALESGTRGAPAALLVSAATHARLADRGWDRFELCGANGERVDAFHAPPGSTPPAPESSLERAR